MSMIDHFSVQRALADAGFYKGPVDGIFGAGSRAAARKLMAQMTNPKLTTYDASWSDDRVRVAVEQWMMGNRGFDVGKFDGLPGPRTQIALERWQDWIQLERPPLDKTMLPEVMPTVWPRQADMAKFYGKPGTHQVHIVPPYPIFYGDQELKKGYLIHKKCADSRMRVYDRTLKAYTLDDIHELGLDRFGGCFNNRTMRNGTTLSTHAYACAEDWDPVRNSLRMTGATAQFAKPEYKPFLDAFEAEGWISLGRYRNFDWMHFQAARP